MTSHRERGQASLELPEARGGRDVGAQQVPAVDVPDEPRRKQRSQEARSREGTELRRSGRRLSLFVALDPGVLVLPAVAFLRPFDVQLLVTELVGCRRLWRSHEEEKKVTNKDKGAPTLGDACSDLLSPQMYLHCRSLVLHLPLKQRPCGQTRKYQLLFSI